MWTQTSHPTQRSRSFAPALEVLKVVVLLDLDDAIDQADLQTGLATGAVVGIDDGEFLGELLTRAGFAMEQTSIRIRASGGFAISPISDGAKRNRIIKGIGRRPMIAEPKSEPRWCGEIAEELSEPTQPAFLFCPEEPGGRKVLVDDGFGIIDDCGEPRRPGRARELPSKLGLIAAENAGGDLAIQVVVGAGVCIERLDAERNEIKATSELVPPGRVAPVSLSA